MSNLPCGNNYKSMRINFIVLAHTIQSSTFYLHYPCPITQVLAFGNKEHYMIGEGSRRGVTDKPVALPKLDIPVKVLRQRTHFLFALTEDGTLYRCGSKTDWRDQYQELKIYDKDLPDEPIVDLRAG